MKNIVVACGTGIATSTLVMSRMKDILEKHNLNFNLIQCTYTEVNGLANDNTVLIIASSNIGKEINGVPVLVGVPFISGVGVEALEEKILEIIR